MNFKKYLHEQCWTFAIAAHKATGWPCFIVADEEEGFVHAFVSPDGKTQAFDASGMTTVQQILRRYQATNPQVEPIEPEGLEFLGNPTSKSMAKAAEAAQHLWQQHQNPVNGATRK